MTLQYVEWYSCTKLPCTDEDTKTVLICVKGEALSGIRTCSYPWGQVPGLIVSSSQGQTNCGNKVWKYRIEYDDEDLYEGALPLSSSEILGVTCVTVDIISDKIRAVSTEAELLDAEADSDICTIIVVASFALTQAVTITKQLMCLPCGVISTAGFVLTLEGAFEAGPFQVFETDDDEIYFGESSIERVLLEWFGAVGDGVTNDTVAVQLAIDASVSGGGRFPVHPLGSKNYGITTVNIPARATIGSEMGRTSGAKFTGLASGVMFQLPAAYSENQITFRGGLVIDGNNVATTLINTGFASGLVIDGVSFMYATTGIDHTGGGIINKIVNCRFSGDFITPIKIGGLSLGILIAACMINCKGTNLILTDSTWVGDDLTIRDCIIDPVNAVDCIKILRLNNATPTLHVRIEDNRFDGSTGHAHIYIGQYVYANINGNQLSGNTNGGMYIDGDEVTIRDNYLAAVGIEFGTLSRSCIAGPQKWGGFVLHFIDNGASNRIDAWDAGRKYKGTTAQRPTLLATGMTGFMYLDTTLAAAGAPIFWADTAWVNKDGTVV